MSSPDRVKAAGDRSPGPGSAGVPPAPVGATNRGGQDARAPSMGASAARELAEQVERLYRLADATLTREGIEAIDDATIQRLVTLGVKLYVARREQGHDLSPFVGGDSVTATEVAATTMGMLKAVNLDLFELSLWRHWGRIERGAEESTR
jgi:hypothetical protein